MKERAININGVKLNYLTAGHGQPFILLHSGLASSKVWGRLFDRLSERFTVYAWDARGHGKSTDTDEPWSYRQLANDLEAMIQELGLEKPTICGWSDGGQTALEHAYLYPDSASRYIVGGAYMESTMDLWDKVKIYGVFKDGAVDFDLLQQNMPELVERIKTNHSYFGDDQWETVVKKAARLWSSFERYEIDQLEKIQTPTLIILGDQDMISVEQAVKLHRTIKNSNLSIYPGADQSLMQTHMQKVLVDIEYFMSRSAK